METLSVMIPEEDVLARVREMAEQITKDYQGKELKLICILKGSVFFTTELAKRIDLPVKLDFMSVSSYGNGTESTGRIRIVKDLDENIRDEHVLVIEDIIDSGRTLSFLMDMLKNRQPASLALCTLLDKPSRRVTDVRVDYTGFRIPDEFVVGFGLDYAQKYRALPYIGKISITQDGENE